MLKNNHLSALKIALLSKTKEAGFQLNKVEILLTLERKLQE